MSDLPLSGSGSDSCPTCDGRRSGDGAYGKWTCPDCTASSRNAVEDYIARRYGIVSAPMPDDEVDVIIAAATEQAR